MDRYKRYVYYTDYGYDDNGGRRGGIGFGCWIAISIVVMMLTVMFCIVYSCIDTYKELVDYEKEVKVAFSNVQNAMQSMIEEIPEQTRIANEASEHFETIYADISDVRVALKAASTPDELDVVNAQLAKCVKQFLEMVETYPTATVNDLYSELMDSVEDAEKRIMVAIEDYNNIVNKYNTAIRNFPGTLVVKFYDFEELEEFEPYEETNNRSVFNFCE